MNSQSSLSATSAATSWSYQQQLNDDLPVDIDLNRIPCKKKMIKRIELFVSACSIIFQIIITSIFSDCRTDYHTVKRPSRHSRIEYFW